MTAPLLQIERLSLRFGAAAPVVDDVSLTVGAGERVALVGESGSGKTLTALSVLQLVDGATQSGSIRFDGDELIGASERTMRTLRGSRIAMVFQEPMTALNPLLSIGAQIVEAITLHEALPSAVAKERAVALLAKTGIDEPARRFDSLPHQLSGGQRQRAMIAAALACRPQLLIADEPTTALDMTLRAQIIDLLRDLQAEFGMAVLLITHDLKLVKRFAQRVAVLEKGRIVEAGDTAAVFGAPQHPYTQRLLHSTPARNLLPVLPIAPVVLDASGLSVAYPRRAAGWAGWFGTRPWTALDRISLALHEGETLGIVGESGSGKTTLALALLGLQRLAGGAVRFAGNALSELNPSQRRAARAGLQIVFQDPFGALSPRKTVGAIVGEGLALHHPGLDPGERSARVVAALREVGLDRTVLARYPHEFSGGQRQRIAIARVLVLRPRVLILDEPTSALDVSTQQQVLALLVDLQKKYNLSYLLISHDLDVVRALSHRVAVLRQGRVVETGDTETLFAKPQNPYTRALVKAAGYL